MRPRRRVDRKLRRSNDCNCAPAEYFYRALMISVRAYERAASAHAKLLRNLFEQLGKA
jgi:sugar lactone lactonase YvrE